MDDGYGRWSTFFSAIFELLFRSGLLRECQVGADYSAKNNKEPFQNGLADPLLSIMKKIPVLF